MTSLSVIVPLYNEQESLPEFCDSLFAALASAELRRCFEAPFSFEVIMVDDGSTDGSDLLIGELMAGRPELRLVSFRRNYGKTEALSAGFRAASGEVVVTIDADMQDDPTEIAPLVMKIREGYDLVSGWKRERNDPVSKTVPSKLFNLTTRLFSGIALHDFNCGLKAYSRELASALDLHGEMHRYIPVLAQWKGFRVTEIPVRHHARKYGTSKYGVARFFAGLFDFLSVMFITRYLKRPMHFFGMMSLGSFFFGFCISLYVTIEKYMFDKPAGNRPILFLGILLIILGVQFFSTGLVGELLSTRTTRQGGWSIRRTENLPDEIIDKLSD
ncbi:glycosyltransferase family 2 protein [Chlorobaculum thiosulfatiphilum]|uniref:Glycosyltransferase family 2 protein n=1 Tax=Chlorobaculum thiosulfatiphilum TaxID=115852 RepID=A0A5C4S4U5_CHLTI|nr:glycosyltransferase family 2 protein [Chlorobaculum thiosulfatiphilum]TNJ38325.1 glycosyltransferase family 2 protein [Chlorobaculum thiosulfatiphilum]